MEYYIGQPVGFLERNVTHVGKIANLDHFGEDGYIVIEFGVDGLTGITSKNNPYGIADNSKYHTLSPSQFTLLIPKDETAIDAAEVGI